MNWGTAMGVITGILLVTYLGIVVWAWRKERKEAFDEAARYPLFEEADRL